MVTLLHWFGNAVDVKNGLLYMQIRLTSLSKGGAEFSGLRGAAAFCAGRERRLKCCDFHGRDRVPLGDVGGNGTLGLDGDSMIIHASWAPVKGLYEGPQSYKARTKSYEWEGERGPPNSTSVFRRKRPFFRYNNLLLTAQIGLQIVECFCSVMGLVVSGNRTRSTINPTS